MSLFESFEDLLTAIPEINDKHEECFNIVVSYGPFMFTIAALKEYRMGVGKDTYRWIVFLYGNCDEKYAIRVERYNHVWLEKCGEKEIHNVALHRMLTREISKMIEITKDDPFPFDAIEPLKMISDGKAQARLNALKEEYKKEKQ